MNNSKVEELTNRTILLLEKTKKEYKKFAEERKQLYSYLMKKENIEKWEEYVKQLEGVIKVQK